MTDLIAWRNGTNDSMGRNPAATEADASYALRAWSCCEGEGGYEQPWRSIYASGECVFSPLIGDTVRQWTSPTWVFGWANPADATQRLRFQFYCVLNYNVPASTLEFVVPYYGVAGDGVTTWPWGEIIGTPTFPVIEGFAPTLPLPYPAIVQTTISLENAVADPRMEVSVETPYAPAFTWEFTGLSAALLTPPGWSFQLPPPSGAGCYFLYDTVSWGDNIGYWDGTCNGSVDIWPTEIALP